MLTNKDFLDDAFRKKCVQDYEDIRHRRKQRKGKPSVEELAVIECERVFESFYKKCVI